MHQASANVGVATANLYPQITLSPAEAALAVASPTADRYGVSAERLPNRSLMGARSGLSNERLLPLTRKRERTTSRSSSRLLSRLQILCGPSSVMRIRCRLALRQRPRRRQPTKSHRNVIQQEASVSFHFSMPRDNTFRRSLIAPRPSRIAIAIRHLRSRHSAEVAGTKSSPDDE